MNAPGTEDDITYTYGSCLNGSGRLCNVRYGPGFPNGSPVHYQYNTFCDRIGHQDLLYGYDNAGRVATIDYPSGAQLAYFYEAAGNINQVDYTVGGQTQALVSALAYAPFGPMTTATYGNGKSLTTTLDNAYRITGITIPGVLERTYPIFDGNGNLNAITDTLLSNSSHSYDALNRLNTSSGPFGARDYEYDKNGNRAQLIADSQTTAYTYEPTSNRLDQIGSTDVLLDYTGNLIITKNTFPDLKSYAISG